MNLFCPISPTGEVGLTSSYVGHIWSDVSSRILLYNICERHIEPQPSNWFFCSSVSCPFIFLSPFFQLSSRGQWPHLNQSSVTAGLPVCLRGDESARHLLLNLCLAIKPGGYETEMGGLDQTESPLSSSTLHSNWLPQVPKPVEKKNAQAQ